MRARFSGRQIQPSVSRTAFEVILIPAMNRWAIFSRPLRGLVVSIPYFRRMIDSDPMGIIRETKIELKGLSPEWVNNLLPDGLISLCWRGSVAHGMYVPKTDPDSIDDKDIMGIYVAEREHYLGFGRKNVYEKWEGELPMTFQLPSIYLAPMSHSIYPKFSCSVINFS